MCSQIKTFLCFATSQLPNLLPSIKAHCAEQVPVAEREKQGGFFIFYFFLFYLIHIIASPWEILLKDQCGFSESRETLHLGRRVLWIGQASEQGHSKNLKQKARRAHTG